MKGDRWSWQKDAAGGLGRVDEDEGLVGVGGA
jgi:hypothetical protein